MERKDILRPAQTEGPTIPAPVEKPAGPITKNIEWEPGEKFPIEIKPAIVVPSNQ